MIKLARWSLKARATQRGRIDLPIRRQGDRGIVRVGEPRVGREDAQPLQRRIPDGDAGGGCAQRVGRGTLQLVGDRPHLAESRERGHATHERAQLGFLPGATQPRRRGECDEVAQRRAEPGRGTQLGNDARDCGIDTPRPIKTSTIAKHSEPSAAACMRRRVTPRVRRE